VVLEAVELSFSLLKTHMTGQSPVNVLVKAHGSRAVIHDFCPLADSLEWKIGQSYLHERGNKAFTSDPSPVPFTINNDGNLSVRAAAVFFSSLAAADKAGALEPTIFVLELGIGVGLFARFFLDAFQELCEQHGTDYYDRLCYVAGDHSEKMLLDAGRCGVFANHPGHYALRVVDALCPEKSLAKDPLFAELDGRPFRALFLNYLLDCLPAAVLKADGQEVRQLWVRSCLTRGANLADHGGLTVEELVLLANGPDPQSSTELRRVYGLLASEYEYRPVKPADVGYGDFGVRFARSVQSEVVVHNYGAIQTLERLLELLGDTGFILINDYGNVRTEGADEFQHQRYSQSTFIGINFALLKSYFTQGPAHQWIEPPEGENTSIHARLLGRQPAPETVACFQDRFGNTALDQVQEPVQMARNYAMAGRLEAALTAYQRALENQPYNWALMNEVSQFLTFSLRDAAAGLEMARAALARNPSCSTELWNMLGDSLFELGRIEESRQAYLRALQINPEDPRAHFNLTFVHLRTKEYTECLRRTAETLALDQPGSYRDRLLRTQSEVLARLTQHRQQEYLQMANRISTRPDGQRAGETNASGALAQKVDGSQRQSSHMTAAPSGLKKPSESL
jgi:tetratricopeptide (TPR) repeat protein